MKAAQILKEKVSNKEPTIGLLATFHLWVELVESAIAQGYDYLIADLEHKDHGHALVADICAIGRMTDFPILVRPQKTDVDSIRTAMDLGPCGLLLPMIEDAAMLDEVQQGIYLPPRGNRRPGGSGNMWVSDFYYDNWKTEVEDDLVIIPQIESVAGLDNVDAIAQHEIVTALGAGPYDLAARLGTLGHPDHPKHREALDRLRSAADNAGKAMWRIGDGVALRREGYHFICAGEPAVMLYRLMGDVAKAIREV
ncbi:MAG: aldolase/citrate lyase family protein [Lentisphaeria bacterium]|nr:aldolase/citrate lyase family protein [Lentisphaeria bacterium]MDP7742635.1 aldolase/citrate lyase family protein [Lentisphaeria bacterium]